MLTSNLKEYKHSREQIFGPRESFANPSITEIFASHKFDFVAIDMEHGTINLEQAQRIIAASQYFKVSSLPKPVSHSNDWIKPLLEFGAAGLDSFKRLNDFAKSQPALGRLPTINKMAEHSLFLISEKASGITGQSINIACRVSPN
jgi:2-dehydro-3-deoxyglucarate aldolase